METNKKKILIVGSSACAYTLAKKLLEQGNIEEIFVAAGSDAMKEFATVVDIREYNVKELLDFAMENAIDLTIVTSEIAITNDIATIFTNNNMKIFAPTKNSAYICENKSNGMKFAYKNKILTPRFGIFEKTALAIDYIQKQPQMPIVIKAETHQDKGVMVCSSIAEARNFMDKLFDSGEKRVLVEDYIFGHEFSFYIITDGYHALPLGSVATYKYELEGNGGAMSAGMGAFADDTKVSQEIQDKIMQQIIYPTLNSLANSQTPYVGILGVDLVMDCDKNIFIIEFNPFLKEPDAQCLLSLINENLYDLFSACYIGAFADEYETLDIDNATTASLVICATKEGETINGLSNLDFDTQVSHFKTKKINDSEYETIKGRSIILTRKARVASKAIEDLYAEAEEIKFSGIKYRKDIGVIQ